MTRIVFIFVAVLMTVKIVGQESKTVELQYISPKPGSKFIMPGNNIALRYGQPLSKQSIHSSLLDVKSKSGEKIEGGLKLSTDRKTLIYKPSKPFPLGETIYVELKEGLLTRSELLISPVHFEFTITDKIIQTPDGYHHCYNNHSGHHQKNRNSFEKESTVISKDNNLPDGFPEFNIHISDNFITDKYFFFAPWTFTSYTTPFLIIMDAHGVPVFYRAGNSSIRDLKVQKNGYLSFAMTDPQYKNFVMDSSYCIIDSFQIGNDYPQTDPHDFQLLENGHAFVIALDWQIVAMDTIVPGGHPSALVGGFIIQEQDQEKNVIFQWRSWDHFAITDVGPQIDLTDYLIDCVHGNAVEVESDTSILISSRSLDEITKIHRNTGEIIWRFGGKKNQFNIQNDTLGFTMQHDCRRLANGHLTLFDNGTMHPEPKYSSVLEYELDENLLEATLVRRLRNDPDIYGGAMGNAQRINDSCYIVGWGNGMPGITELTLDGEQNIRIAFQGVSYRAYHFPWETNYFYSNTDSLQFEVKLPDSAIQEIQIINANEFEIELSSIYNRNPAFSSTNDFPVIVPASDSVTLHIKFLPDSLGPFKDVLTINSDINNDTLVQRVAQQVFLTGIVRSSQSVYSSKKKQFLIYPNPTDENLMIEFPQKRFSGKVKLYNIYGELVYELMIDKSQKIKLNLAKYPKGLYFVSLTEQYNGVSELYKIVKN